MSDRAPATVRLRTRLARVDRSEWGFVGLIVLLWGALYLVGLGDLSVHVWDESRYVSPARDMANGANWLIPEIRINTFDFDIDHTPRLQKPPLLYWLQALSMMALGPTAFAGRLPTALAALGCAGVVYGIGRRTWDARAGLAGAALFLVFPGMLLGSHGGTAGVPDTLMTLFGSLFVWLTWRGRERPRLLVPAAVFAGLAVLTKGFAAGVLVVAVVPIVLRFYRSYLTPWTAVAVATTTGIALPWHLYAYLTHPEIFVQDYLQRAVTSRIAGDLSKQGADPLVPFFNYPYVRYGIEAVLPPWPYLLPLFGIGALLGLGLVVWLVRRDGRRAHLDKLMLVWWAAAVPVTFAIGGGNQPWYLLPMYVPGAVIVGYVPAAVADGTAATIIGRWDAGHRLAGWVGRWRPRRSSISEVARSGAFAAVVVVLVAGIATASGPPLHDSYNDGQRELGQALNAAVPPDETVHVFLGRNASTRALMSTEFYADRDLAWTTPRAIRSDESIRYALVPHGSADTYDRPHRVLARSPENDLDAVAFEDG
ncbi:MAG: ArnT family glycosyltransferase [Halobacteriota archaeon]